jgi:hypothetical protein
MTQSYLEPTEANSLWSGSEDPDMYTIVALDNGGTSGWCVMGIHPDAMTGDPDIRVGDNIQFWTAGQFTGDEDEQCDEIVELIASWPSARLVTELFTLRTRITSSEVFALERMNAILRWAIRPRYFVYQQPSLAMTTITDDRQKSMGFWIPGKEHARDAVKHALTFAKRKKEQAIKAQLQQDRRRP